MPEAGLQPNGKEASACPTLARRIGLRRVRVRTVILTVLQPNLRCSVLTIMERVQAVLACSEGCGGGITRAYNAHRGWVQEK